MKILILGADGYIGYPLTLHLLKLGHEVSCIDDESRRLKVKEIGSESLTPITRSLQRYNHLIKYSNFAGWYYANLNTNTSIIREIIRYANPECIIHLAEQPSAPYSMMNSLNSISTQYENVIGTLNLLWMIRENCPDTHLIKIGTMGEYGTPNCDIPEGFIPSTCIDMLQEEGKSFTLSCPMKGLLFPRSPGSFYHLSKVHDTLNIKFACDTWGLRSTDIMQGVLFGVRVTGEETDRELTRFDYDEYFGTVINRFCVQALIDHPLTIYGRGCQQRGFLPLKDSIQCLTIAVENPPANGEYRTWNQFENVYSINLLANMICRCAADLGIHSSIRHIQNPRTELDEHYYNPTCKTLFDLGYKPTTDIKNEISNLLMDILPYKDKIIKDVIMPKTMWR